MIHCIDIGWRIIISDDQNKVRCASGAPGSLVAGAVLLVSQVADRVTEIGVLYLSSLGIEACFWADRSQVVRSFPKRNI